MKFTLLKLAQVGSAHFRFVSKFVLRHAFRVAKAAQVGGEHFPQVHAERKAACSIYAPLYIEQNAYLSDYTVSRTGWDDQ